MKRHFLFDFYLYRLLMKCLALLFLSFALTIQLYGQKPSRIELLHADVSEFDNTINAGADRLLGNVAFRHENAVMTCDSAYLYKEQNNLEAFGRVRINQGDTTTMTGKHLIYLGDTRLAQMFEDVVMRDRKMTLNTQRLDYNMETDVASYTDSAHIVDGEDVLTSRFGYYYSRSRDLFFKEDVLLVNPEFRMTCDTLRYNTVTKTAHFMGPTYIRSDENLIYCESGWYNTELQTSLFTGNSYLQSKEQTLRGDTVTYDRTKAIGRGIGNVSVYDSTNQVIISGDYAEHHELRDSSFVTGRATMIQVYESDSLFMHGDTLKAVADSTGQSVDSSGNRKRNLYAYHNVKLFRTDLQGKCDSLVYSYSDSTIRMYTNPVLWSGLNQLTADSITIQTANSRIDRMYLVNSSFIVSRADSLQSGVVDSLRFNQIRGKNMTGYFSDNKLYEIRVNGNGQTIYYGKNKQEKNFGVNRADCSDLIIRVNENKVQQISLLNEPDGTLYPINELATKELRLKGFVWMDEDRPKTKEDIYLRRPEK
jgi:lipopolysaccharide export system protein LptA